MADQGNQDVDLVWLWKSFQPQKQLNPCTQKTFKHQFNLYCLYTQKYASSFKMDFICKLRKWKLNEMYFWHYSKQLIEVQAQFQILSGKIPLLKIIFMGSQVGKERSIDIQSSPLLLSLNSDYTCWSDCPHFISDLFSAHFQIIQVHSFEFCAMQKYFETQHGNKMTP